MPSRNRRRGSPRLRSARAASTACRSACGRPCRNGTEPLTPDQARAILDFWFSQDPERWWKVDPAFDQEIRDRFHELWEAERENLPDHFLADPETALAG